MIQQVKRAVPESVKGNNEARLLKKELRRVIGEGNILNQREQALFHTLRVKLTSLLTLSPHKQRGQSEPRCPVQLWLDCEKGTKSWHRRQPLPNAFIWFPRKQDLWLFAYSAHIWCIWTLARQCNECIVWNELRNNVKRLMQNNFLLFSMDNFCDHFLFWIRNP